LTIELIPMKAQGDARVGLDIAAFVRLIVVTTPRETSTPRARTIRALGWPSGPTVARVIALGFGCVRPLLARASHSASVENGSAGSTSGNCSSLKPHAPASAACSEAGIGPAGFG
jgi:hypothetical protein